MGKYGEGTNYAKAQNPTSENVLDPGILGGKLRVMQDYFTFPATTTMTSNQYIVVGKKLPTGSQVVSIILSNGGVGTGTDGFLAVGDQGDEDRYISVVQSTTAGVTIGPNVPGGMNYQVTGTTDNYIRVCGSADALCINSGGTVKVSILYVVE